MPTHLNRADLLSAFPGLTPKALRGLEDQAVSIDEAATSATAAVAATRGLNAATVLTLSPNDAFDNERVLALSDSFTAQDAGGGKTFTLRLRYPYRIIGGYGLTWSLTGDTTVTLPTTGKLATTILPGPYDDDAGAKTGGVAIGESYRKTGGVVAWRQA